jgi:hypothetical protein
MLANVFSNTTTPRVEKAVRPPMWPWPSRASQAPIRTRTVIPSDWFGLPWLATDGSLCTSNEVRRDRAREGAGARDGRRACRTDPLPGGGLNAEDAGVIQNIVVTHMMMAATAITAVVSHPINLTPSWMRNGPMIFGLPVMCIIAIMIGTATTPLMTALQ